MRQRTVNNVLTFPRRFQVLCSEITQAEADEIQNVLSDILSACPACRGRGVFPHKHPITGSIAFSPCPCGGTDEDRIDHDFDGAA